MVRLGAVSCLFSTLLATMTGGAITSTGPGVRCCRRVHCDGKGCRIVGNCRCIGTTAAQLPADLTCRPSPPAMPVYRHLSPPVVIVCRGGPGSRLPHSP